MTGGLGALCASNHDNVWKPATHHAYRQLMEYAKGISLQTKVDCPRFDIPGYAIDDTSQYTGKNNLPYIDSACAYNEQEGKLAVFVINRNQTEAYPVDLDIRGFENLKTISHYEIYTGDFDKKSSFGNDWKQPETNPSASMREGIASTMIKPLSWNVIVFE